MFVKVFKCFSLCFAISSAMSGERRYSIPALTTEKLFLFLCRTCGHLSLSLSFTINVITKGNHKYFFYFAVYQFQSIHVGKRLKQGLLGRRSLGRGPKNTTGPETKQKARFSRLDSKIFWT